MNIDQQTKKALDSRIDTIARILSPKSVTNDKMSIEFQYVISRLATQLCQQDPNRINFVLGALESSKLDILKPETT